MEDPAIGFQRLRDHVDVKWFMANMNELDMFSQLKSTWSQSNQLNDVDKVSSFSRCFEMVDRMLNDVAATNTMIKQLKLISPQVRFILRSLQYCFLHSAAAPSNGSDDDWNKMCVNQDTMKAFRLSNKREILSRNQYLKNQSKQFMQNALDELYREEETRYRNVFKCFSSYN